MLPPPRRTAVRSNSRRRKIFSRQTEPPAYNFLDARVNTSMVFVKNDAFIGPATTRKTISWLKPNYTMIVEDERFSHLDILWSWRAACLVYDFVLKQLTGVDDARGADYVEYRQSVNEHLKSVEIPRCRIQDSV